MLDMLIQGGRVVTPAGLGDWDVGIEGEKIVAVAFPGLLPATATQVIDARGKIVVPGGIETHARELYPRLAGFPTRDCLPRRPVMLVIPGQPGRDTCDGVR